VKDEARRLVTSYVQAAGTREPGVTLDWQRDDPTSTTLTNGSAYSGPRRHQRWEYRLVPLKEAAQIKKGLSSDRLTELGSKGWEAVGLTLRKGDRRAWPVVLLKRAVD
jgi:hypothetical protein